MDNIKIVRSIHRKSVGIQVLPNGCIKVSIPFFIPKFYVKKILQEKAEWIKNAQQKILSQKAEKLQEGSYFYLGKKYLMQERLGQKGLVEIADKLYVASANKKFVTTYLTSWYKQEARKIIIERVNHYANIAGLSFRSVAITTAETRWGSCSSNKTLNFNWKLVMAPLEVIDYVVAHELAHLTELNHSRDFWETVRKMYPLYREHRTWLKRNGHLLTL